MNQSIKSALLSALIFPGVGQISAGFKKRGWIIILANCVFLYLIMSEIIQQVYNTIDRMKKSGMVMDIENISNSTSAQVGFSDNTYLNSLLVILIISWFCSIIDAYWLGNKKP